MTRAQASVPEQHDRAGASSAAAPEALRVLRRRTRRRVALLVGLAVVCLAAFVVSLIVGPIALSPAQIAQVFFDPAAPAQARTVVLQLRLPPALLALLVGGALAVGGLEMQTILDNPLAEPFTLGVSAAAAFGASLAIVTGAVLPWIGGYTLAVFAGVAALGASALIGAASIWRGASKDTLVLLGIALVFGFQALLSLLQYRASTESLQQIVFWSMGSLTRASWPAVVIVAATLAIALPVLWANNWRLTALRLGEARAAAMGINVGRVRLWTLLGVSVLAATSVAFVGIIGFIGLVGPHVARFLVGEDQRFLLPASVLCGAGLLCGAHAVSQVLVPGVSLPVGIVTALVGVPVFVALVLGRRRGGMA